MAVDLKIKESLRSVKILLVEDDHIISTLMRDVLGAMGFTQVTSAKTAERALDEIKLNYFDLIITDWRLDEVSGIDFAKSVRRLNDSLKKFVPIIMVTGMAQEEDVKTARDVGVTEYIIKPFRVASIAEKIKSILDRPRQFVVAESYVGPDRRRKSDNANLPPHGNRRKRQG